jgi:elongator complex protein 3
LATDIVEKQNFKPENHVDALTEILFDLDTYDGSDPEKRFHRVLRKHNKSKGILFTKDELIKGYHYLIAEGKIKASDRLAERIRMKPTRSISGVLPLTILTKPFPCPGKCIFCPNDIRMPKSYLSDEPGAQRAERNQFDPYLQTYNRLLAFKNTGHNVAKIEVIILGGTWSYYPERYQVWFIKRCFEAINDFSAGLDKRGEVKTINIHEAQTKNKREYTEGGRRRNYNELITEKERTAGANSLEQATWEELIIEQEQNVKAKVKCVGLVIETRPDHVDEAEVLRVRRLGATKTQIGFQSLNDEVLELNKRGHDVESTRKAVALARTGGFKIHAHWMPNLYGSTPEKDKQDFLKLWTPDFQPDELKIYPCSLIETAELMEYYEKGLWKPYTREELLDVMSFAIANTPRYVRLTRVIRDIPSTDIVTGNKETNFREVVENYLKANEIKIQDIRAREIKSKAYDSAKLMLRETVYMAKNSYGSTRELFLEFITPDDKICGFLRLSLPENRNNFIPELVDSAIIREVHVYGTAQIFGDKSKSSAQHIGLGTRLINRAKEIAKEAGFHTLSVISAIGTRGYYEKLDFKLGELYQHTSLD